MTVAYFYGCVFAVALMSDALMNELIKQLGVCFNFQGLVLVYTRELKWPLNCSVRIYRHYTGHELCSVCVRL